MSLDLGSLGAAVARHGRVARVVVVEARGSAPREAGAAMLVWEDGQSGTIGGGTLEWEAAAAARALLPGGGTAVERRALGPDLGQCCGGAVVLALEVWDAARLAAHPPVDGLVARPLGAAGAMPLLVRRRLAAARGQGATGGIVLEGGWLVEPVVQPRRALWVWGAGHVGRAIVAVMAPLPGVAITWVDTAADRFPADLPEGVERVVAADPAALVPFAPAEADHLVLTYSHALDLALCHALLSRGAGSLGLIGSATKRARFRRRLMELGHGPEAVGRMRCPIGDPALGKHPQAIAVSVAAEWLGAARVAARREGTG